MSLLATLRKSLRQSFSLSIMLLTILAVAAPVIGFTIYLFGESRSAERRLVETETSLVADVVSRKFKSYFANRLAGLEQLAAVQSDPRQGASNTQSFLQQLRRHFPEMEMVRLIDNDLRTRVLYSSRPIAGASLPDPSWSVVSNAWHQGQPLASSVFALPTSGNGIFLYGPIVRQNRVVGLVEGLLRLHEGFMSLAGAELTDYWYLQVRDEGGRSVYGWLPARTAQEELAFARRPVQWLNQKWAFYISPKASLYESLQTPSPYRILLLGWIATAIVTCVAFLATNRQRRVESSLQETRRLSRDIDTTRRQLSELINGVDAIVWTLDLRTWRYTFVSDAAERLLGHPLRRWLEDENFWATSIHPEDRALVRRAHEEAARSRVDQHLDYRMVGADGRSVWVKNRITPIMEGKQVAGLRGLIVDISQRKSAELQVRESEKRFRDVMENMSLLVLVLNREGRIVFCNDPVALKVQRPREELQGALFFDLLAPEEQREARRGDFDCMMRGETFNPHRQTEIVTRSGQRRLISWNIVLMRDPDGKIIGLTSIGEDITNRAAEEEALRQSQKLESLGILTGGIAHDFNNLLTAIMGNTELAQEQLTEDSAAQPYLEKVATTTRRLADLTRQMLAYSGKSNFTIAPVDLNAVIREMAGLVEVSISKHVSTHYELSPEPLWVMADAVQIEQVVLNLITNASEAIGTKRGQIILRTRERRMSEEEIRTEFPGQNLAPGDYLCLEVVDNGCGMAPETLPKIFDPFFTTKFTGRGLGLAALQGIVRGHKGGIQIESELNRGTTFRIYFPVTAPPAVPKAATRRRRLSLWKSRGVALIVDDEVPLRTMAAQVLEAQGFTVLQAENGKQGLELFQQHAENIAVVLLDLTMPVMGGEEAFERMIAFKPDARIILISGYSQEDAVHRFPRIGLAGFIQKPFLPSEMLETIRRVLEQPAPRPARSRAQAA